MFILILLLLVGCATQPLPYKVENFIREVQYQADKDGLKFDCTASAELAKNLIEDHKGWTAVKPIETCKNGEKHQYVVAKNKEEEKTYQILRCQ